MRNDVTKKTRAISWFYSKGSSTVPEVVNFYPDTPRTAPATLSAEVRSWSVPLQFPGSLHYRYIPNSIVHFPPLFFSGPMTAVYRVQHYKQWLSYIYAWKDTCKRRIFGHKLCFCDILC
jgi:hypothetical protein